MKEMNVNVGDMVDVTDKGKVFLSNVLLEEIKTNIMGWKKTYRLRGNDSLLSSGSGYISDIWEIRAGPEIEIRLHEPTEKIPPKSKFMEDWGNLKVKPSEVFNGVGIWDVLKDLVKLIDNHKADK